MDNAGYVALTRMRGLGDEMRAVANNIANVSTTGYRAHRLVFAEVIMAVEGDGGGLAMAEPRAHVNDPTSGGYQPTGGDLDLAIDGPGFFQIMGPNGPQFTRAGSFVRNADGNLMTRTGFQVLDAGGAPIAIPPDATDIAIGRDGTIAADGNPVAQIGVFTIAPAALRRADGVAFNADGPAAAVEDPGVLQGFIENSNVNPVAEMSRMIEVQRSYELGQTFLDREDERLREAVRTLGRTT